MNNVRGRFVGLFVFLAMAVAGQAIARGSRTAVPIGVVGVTLGVVTRPLSSILSMIRAEGALRTVTALLFAGTLLTVHESWALYKTDSDKSLWPVSQGIPVCWAPDINPKAFLPKLIQYRVENLWGRYASIWFTGWDRCASDTPGGMPDEHIIFIRTTSGRPRSDVGRRFDDNFSGKPRPTVMELNFDGLQLACKQLGFSAIGASRENCSVWYAIHEFGHALGFVHEHARKDFPECRDSRLDVFDWFFKDKRAGGGKNITVYDSTSVMNYCAAGAGTNRASLSANDILGLQIVYGRKPAGSIVGVGGRCLDVPGSAVIDGNQVILWDCHGEDNQRWHFSPEDGRLSTELNRDVCLDDASANRQPGTPVDIWPCDHRANTRWSLGAMSIRAYGGRYVKASTDRGLFVTDGLDSGYDPVPHGWMLTDRNELRLGHSKFKNTNKCMAVGDVGRPARLEWCNHHENQKFWPTVNGELISNGGCLEVPISGELPDARVGALFPE